MSKRRWSAIQKLVNKYNAKERPRGADAYEYDPRTKRREYRPDINKPEPDQGHELVGKKWDPNTTAEERDLIDKVLGDYIEENAADKKLAKQTDNVGTPRAKEFADYRKPYDLNQHAKVDHQSWVPEEIIYDRFGEDGRLPAKMVNRTYEARNENERNRLIRQLAHDIRRGRWPAEFGGEALYFPPMDYMDGLPNEPRGVSRILSARESWREPPKTGTENTATQHFWGDVGSDETVAAKTGSRLAALKRLTELYNAKEQPKGNDAYELRGSERVYRPDIEKPKPNQGFELLSKKWDKYTPPEDRDIVDQIIGDYVEETGQKGKYDKQTDRVHKGKKNDDPNSGVQTFHPRPGGVDDINALIGRRNRSNEDWLRASELESQARMNNGHDRRVRQLRHEGQLGPDDPEPTFEEALNRVLHDDFSTTGWSKPSGVKLKRARGPGYGVDEPGGSETWAERWFWRDAMSDKTVPMVTGAPGHIARYAADKDARDTKEPDIIDRIMNPTGEDNMVPSKSGEALRWVAKKVDSALPEEKDNPEWLDALLDNPIAANVGFESNKQKAARKARGMGPTEDAADALTSEEALMLQKILSKIK